MIQPDQGRPAIDLINQLLKSATGAAIVAKQRVRVRRRSPLLLFRWRQRFTDPDTRRHCCIQSSTPRGLQSA